MEALLDNNLDPTTSPTSKTSKHPLWATQFRKPATELRLINGNYYLYQYSTTYDPIKKRAKKISGKLLGRITQDDGFIPSPKYLLTLAAQNNNTPNLPEQLPLQEQQQQKPQQPSVGSTPNFLK